MPLTRSAHTVSDGDTSNTGVAEKLSERIADAPPVSGQELSPVSSAEQDYKFGMAAASQQYDWRFGQVTSGVGVVAANPKPGVKLDTGKAPVAQGFVAYFRKAMEAIAQVSAYGANKYKVSYTEQNWRKVENGANRYADALQRHFAAHLSGETIDPESKQPHLAHVGWNALALIELQNGLPEKLVDG
jgi:hypothetical protein